VYAEVPPAIYDETTFADIATDCQFFVPASKVNDYKTDHHWSAFEDRIFGFEE